MEEKTIHSDSGRGASICKINHDETFISSKEWNEISRKLEGTHALFYQCWQMGKPRFSSEIKTAAVGFNENGEFVDFVFNPLFWNSLDEYNRLFVISHECLHIVLNHGVRATKKENYKESQIVNYAMDIVINHTLINSFGFDRDKIKNWKDFCWIDTIFDNLEKDEMLKIPSNQSFEYYYNLIKLNQNFDKNFDLDEHIFFPKNWEDVIEKLNGVLSDEEKNAIKPLIEKHMDKSNGKTAGKGEGGWTFVNVNFNKNKKWETIIKNWTKKYIKQTLESKEQWVRLNRRFALLGNSLLLPTEMEEDMDVREKILVYLFLDTSGSCWGFKERFMDVVASIPEKLFETKVFTFDTKVEQVNMEEAKTKGKTMIYGWGGTSFYVIERAIQNEIMHGGEYPEAVFVLTDGFGDYVNPQFPEKWHWILTPHATTSYLPKKSKIYNLKNFN